MWTDERQRFNTTDTDMPKYIPPRRIDEIWLPDVYFPNEKNPDKSLSRSMRVYSNGTIRYVTR